MVSSKKLDESVTKSNDLKYRRINSYKSSAPNIFTSILRFLPTNAQCVCGKVWQFSCMPIRVERRECSVDRDKVRCVLMR